MRVLLVNKYFYNRGGSARSTFTLDRALSERGHTTLHFAMKSPRNVASPWSDYFVPEASYARPRASLGTARAVGRMFHSPEVGRQLGRLVAAGRPDLAIVNNFYHQLGPSVLLELSRLNVPSLMVLRDHKVVCPASSALRNGRPCARCADGRFYYAALHGCGGSRARGALLAAESYWQRHLVHSYDRVTRFAAPSQYLIGKVKEMGFRYPVDLLRNAVSIPATASDPRRNTAVGFAGRLGIEKGVDLLLHAAGALRDVPFRIAGGGPHLLAFQRDVRRRRLDNVRFLGQLSHGALQAEIRRWRLAVVPSLWAENCPLAVLEAFSHGVPVVGSDCGGTLELLEGRGVLFERANARSLQREIESLWRRPERCRETGLRGRRFAIEQCGQKPFGDRLEQLLGLVVGSRSEPPSAVRPPEAAGTPSP